MVLMPFQVYLLGKMGKKAGMLLVNKSFKDWPHI